MRVRALLEGLPMTSIQTFLSQNPQEFTVDPERGGMRILVGTLPCTYSKDLPHPIATVEGRRIARFRRNLEGGMRYAKEKGWSITFVTLAMRYDETGNTKGDLRYSVQRFVQKLRRTGITLEYSRVTEETTVGVRNHAHLVIASNRGLPGEHDLKDVWASVTYGTSYQIKRAMVNDFGVVSRYMAKALGSYMAKSFKNPEGLDSSYLNATDKPRVSTYATFSRGWLPAGASTEWVNLFKKHAYFWLCDRGFYHTELGDTMIRWLGWVRRQALVSI